MINLTRLNGDSFTLNAIYIEQVQSFPDTTLTLHNGKKLVVKESHEEVISLIKEFYRHVGLVGVQVEKEGDSS